MKVGDLNEKELKLRIPPEASWHADYNDTAFISVRGLPKQMNEGDLLILFSQYGNPLYVKLVRDKTTGKSKGTAYIRYEDQRSTVLAVDNFNGIRIMDTVMRVDHYRYKPAPGEVEPTIATLYNDPLLE